METRDALTMDDVARFYKKKTGGNAKIMSMTLVMDWFEKQPEVEYDEQKDCYYFVANYQAGV